MHKLCQKVIVLLKDKISSYCGLPEGHTGECQEVQPYPSRSGVSVPSVFKVESKRCENKCPECEQRCGQPNGHGGLHQVGPAHLHRSWL